MQRPSAVRGQALVEFTLILPFLLLVVIGCIDIGRAVFVNTMLSNAAREGARTGIIPTKTDGDIRAAVKDTAVTITLTDGQITITPACGASCTSRVRGSTVTVSINYPLVPLTPFIGQIIAPSGTLPIATSATMVVE